jgi:hypothetical protein
VTTGEPNDESGEAALKRDVMRACASGRRIEAHFLVVIAVDEKVEAVSPGPEARCAAEWISASGKIGRWELTGATFEALLRMIAEG